MLEQLKSVIYQYSSVNLRAALSEGVGRMRPPGLQLPMYGPGHGNVMMKPPGKLGPALHWQPESNLCHIQCITWRHIGACRSDLIWHRSDSGQIQAASVKPESCLADDILYDTKMCCDIIYTIPKCVVILFIRYQNVLRSFLIN